MPRKNKGSAASQEGSSPRRIEREQRILDTAAQLIQRWGYNKTTIDDIAKHAGVAKGTIYLHWKTREDLFLAVVMREYITILEEFLANLAADPDNATPHGLARQAILIPMRYPLVKAMMLGDTEMLGELARREYADPASVTQRRIEMGKVFIELWRSKGLMRTDMSAQAQIHIFVAIAIGFMVAGGFLPDEFKLPPEQSAELLAETVRRTMEPDGPMPLEQLREVQAMFVPLLNQLIDAVKERSQKE